MTARRTLALIAVLAGALAACARVIDLTPPDAQIAVPDSPPANAGDGGELPDGGFPDGGFPDGGLADGGFSDAQALDGP
jgi:hypothetical protein